MRDSPSRVRATDDHVEVVAELIASALIRLRARPKTAESLSPKVGLDKPGHPRVYVNTLESPGG